MFHWSEIADIYTGQKVLLFLFCHRNWCSHVRNWLRVDGRRTRGWEGWKSFTVKLNHPRSSAERRKSVNRNKGVNWGRGEEREQGANKGRRGERVFLLILMTIKTLLGSSLSTRRRKKKRADWGSEEWMFKWLKGRRLESVFELYRLVRSIIYPQAFISFKELH